MSGYKHTRLYTANGIALTVAWFAIRVFGGMYTGFVIFVRSRPALSVLSTPQVATILVGYSIGMLLQFMWGYKILVGLWKVLTKKKKKKKSED